MLFARSGSSENALHEKWLSEKIGEGRGWDTDTCVTLGVYGETLKAVVLYHDWRPEAKTICMSAAADSKKWLNRAVLYQMHHYPFEQVGCQAVVLQVSENNKPMLRIAEAYGYEMTRVNRLRGRDEAEIICVLYDDIWRENPFTKSYVAKMANSV